jgi:hypothetical protein
METFTVSVDIYIAWRRLLYRIFISHGDVYCMWIFISHGDVDCIGGYLYRMDVYCIGGYLLINNQINQIIINKQINKQIKQ